MIRLRRGTTRFVVVIGRFAIKVPRNRIGLRCNRHEATLWRLNRANAARRDNLCPVLWSLFAGLILVMTAADPLAPGLSPTDEWADFWDYDPSKGEIDEWPGEFKPEDWGLINGRRVLVDYAAPAL